MANSYYEQMRQLARDKRTEYALSTAEIGLASVRNIYKNEGIVIDKCPGKLRKLKAAYFYDGFEASILLNMQLPKEPRLFAMVHELKHHYCDRLALRPCFCQDVYELSPTIEIGAEVFAAEFIFPDRELREFVKSYLVNGKVTQHSIVHMKYHSPVCVSYQFLCKSLERFGLIQKNQFAKVSFQKLHSEIYGHHYYRQPKSRRTIDR